MSIHEAIAGNMKRRRVELGLSLQDVADRASMSKTAIWELEKGRSPNPTIKSVLAITRALSMPMNDLLGMDVSQPSLSEAELALVSAHRAIFRREP